jgi:hypothetical protein
MGSSERDPWLGRDTDQGRDTFFRRSYRGETRIAIATPRRVGCSALLDIRGVRLLSVGDGLDRKRGTAELWKGTSMAKRTVHMLIDDLDGGEADETVRFAIDGVEYEIDLSTKNATKLRDALSTYIEAGSRVGRIAGPTRTAASRRRRPAQVDRDQNRAIRDWAHGKGIEVSDRGRIKQEIVDRYHAEAGR